MTQRQAPRSETVEALQPQRRDFLHFVGGAAAIWCGLDVVWSDRPKLRAADAAPAADPNWGAIKGRIVWAGEGDAPAPQQVDFTKYRLNADDAKYFNDKGPVFFEDWVVKKDNKGLRWVFIWLKPEGDDLAEFKVHPKLAEAKLPQLKLEQPVTGFAPHAMAMREGQEILVTNDSPIFHSVQWAGFGDNANGNVGMRPGEKFTISKLPASESAVRIACAPHPWELAWARVYSHPYFAVSDADGNFEIPLVPTGECRLKIWHETAGIYGGRANKAGQKITIEGGKTLDLGEIAIKPKAATPAKK